MSHLILVLLLPLIGTAQSLTLRVDVTAGGQPVSGAVVTVAGTPYRTDRAGRVTATVGPGRLRLEVSHPGYLSVTKDIEVTPETNRHVIVALDAEPSFEESITVSSTRSDRRLEDQPMRVEVLVREEIEEKMLMTPGDIVMMLNEMGGMRVQPTSPSLGAASVRVQGMRGRYTRFLSDGLPLFGEQPGGLGLLQIPPMDLAQVEVIKGVASALYGAGALGGVVDLISRRPGTESEHEILLNQSTRGGTDGVLWLSSPFGGGWGVTFLGGGHFQQRTDVNDDGWADLPKYSRGVFRPRLFWEDGRGRSIFATAGFTGETRQGGTTGTGSPFDTRFAHIEALDTMRFDAGFVGRALVAGRNVVTVRAAAARQRHEHRFGDVTERDRHVNLFGEVALRGTAGRHTWVAGAAIEHNTFRPRDVPRFAFTHTVPGVFVQDEIDLTRWWSVSASARADSHSEYGWFLSPRLSSLMRGGGWTSRVSIGTGFFGPTALTEETEAAGLTRLQLRHPLRAERGRSFSMDLTRELGPLAITGTVFGSRIRHPIHVERTDEYAIFNLADAATNTGMELLATFRRSPVSVTGSYTYVRARERGSGHSSDVPLTPRHSAGVVAMWEREDAGRIGVEWYYTGRQRLEADAYGTYSRPYAVVGLLAEKPFGRYRLFINGENLTDVRQTRWTRIFRPAVAPDGRVAVDVWAPLEGRNINGGVRIFF